MEGGDEHFGLATRSISAASNKSCGYNDRALEESVSVKCEEKQNRVKCVEGGISQNVRLQIQCMQVVEKVEKDPICPIRIMAQMNNGHLEMVHLTHSAFAYSAYDNVKYDMCGIWISVIGKSAYERAQLATPYPSLAFNAILKTQYTDLNLASIPAWHWSQVGVHRYSELFVNGKDECDFRKLVLSVNRNDCIINELGPNQNKCLEIESLQTLSNAPTEILESSYDNGQWESEDWDIQDHNPSVLNDNNGTLDIRDHKTPELFEEDGTGDYTMEYKRYIFK
uniref:Uncharacterized protein n=1 Tax=Romanomermis culicivorax TaxID=13658 RepID=A0A915L1Y3_ROMCU